MRNKSIGSKLMSAGLVAALTLGLVSTSAFAATVDDGEKEAHNNVSVTINSGGLHLATTDINNFKDVTLDSEIKSYVTGFKDSLQIKDLRGTYEGWNVKVKATSFKNENEHTLPTGSLEIHVPKKVHNKNASENAGAVKGPSNILTEKTVIDSGGEVSIVGANEGEGAGTYEIEFNEDALELTVDPATAKSGTYTSQLTWTLESTPSFGSK